jgi:hypothetical protein
VSDGEDMWRTIRGLREQVRELGGQLEVASERIRALEERDHLHSALDRIAALEAEHQADVRREEWQLREAGRREIPGYDPAYDNPDPPYDPGWADEMEAAAADVQPEAEAG